MEWMDELADDVGEGVLGGAVDRVLRVADKVAEVVMEAVADEVGMA